MINTQVPNNDNVLTDKRGYITAGAFESGQSSIEIVILAFIIDDEKLFTRGIRSV
jgi:hypothetical protein